MSEIVSYSSCFMGVWLGP